MGGKETSSCHKLPIWIYWKCRIWECRRKAWQLRRKSEGRGIETLLSQKKHTPCPEMGGWYKCYLKNVPSGSLDASGSISRSLSLITVSMFLSHICNHLSWDKEVSFILLHSCLMTMSLQFKKYCVFENNKWCFPAFLRGLWLALWRSSASHWCAHLVIWVRTFFLLLQVIIDWKFLETPFFSLDNVQSLHVLSPEDFDLPCFSKGLLSLVTFKMLCHVGFSVLFLLLFFTNVDRELLFLVILDV